MESAKKQLIVDFVGKLLYDKKIAKYGCDDSKGFFRPVRPHLYFQSAETTVFAVFLPQPLVSIPKIVLKHPQAA